EGRMLPFKTGAFLLAIQAQVPIVPVAIEGSGIVLPRGSFRVVPHALRITVGEPIATAGLEPKDRRELAERAQMALETMLGWTRIERSDLERARAEERARLRSRWRSRKG